MKHCEVAAMSKLQNLTLWKEVNKTITFPGDLSKSEQHDPTQPKLSVYPWRFYGDDNTIKRRFQTSVYSEYPWIEYSIKEDVPVCFCCELPFLGEKEALHFLLLSLRD